MEKYKNKEWLKEQYIINEKSMNQIAQECNVAYITINTWIHRFEIKTRSHIEGTQLAFKQGRVSHLWKKGNVNGFKKGNIPWNKGTIGLTKANKTSFKKGNEHRHWRGENASISRKHTWIRENKIKPEKCPKCRNDKKLELSFDHSLGEATRNINDYQYLCKKCHMKRDKRFGIYDYRKI